MEENRVADLVANAYKNQIRTSIPTIHRFIQNETGEVIDLTELQRVIEKMNKTDESLLKEDPPYLSEEQYNRLKEHQKPRKR